MKQFFKKEWIFLFLYLLLFFLLAAIFHRDIVFNPYNFGRHWDWTFLSFSDFYRNFLDRFFFSINNNAFGDYGGIGFSDFLLKSFIYIISQLFPFISAPILNKITIFLTLPLISSLGIWFLARKILKSVYESNIKLFFTLVTLSNLLYTFSLVVMFDMHGGAINRIITTALLPYFFLALYSYFTTSSKKYFIREVFFMSVFFILFDLQNIFYCGTLVMAAILLKKNPLKTKVAHILQFTISISLLNFYWIQKLFLSNSISVAGLLKSKRLSTETLSNYSSTIRDSIFMLATPHNLILTTFGKNLFIYTPYLFLHLILLRIISTIKTSRKYLGLFILLAGGYIFTTILSAGTYSIGNIYLFLYSFPVFGFIQNSVRFMPDLLIFTVFMLLIFLSIRYRESSKDTKIDWALYLIPIVIWTIFLLTNGNLVEKVYDATTKNTPQKEIINNEIGALYQEDPSLLALTRRERLNYNILPVPSWQSPIFTDNIYPKNSQGSDTDIYYSKGVLFTNGGDSQTTKFVEQFINTKPDPTFFYRANIRYIWLKNTFIDDRWGVKQHYFSREWIKNVQKNSKNSLKKVEGTTAEIYQIDLKHFIPEVYIPAGEKQDASINVVEYKKINTTKYLINIHGVKENFSLVLNKQFYPGWEAHLVKYQSKKIDEPALENYKILEGNSADQASSKELRSFINNGWISTLGDGKEKQFKHLAFNNGKEQYDHTEYYTIDFVSNKFHNVIQNDNLKTTLLSFQQHKRLPDSAHKIANTFANSWNIEPSALCKTGFCKKNTDGSYNISIILEFGPQRLFLTSTVISIFSFIFILFLAFILRKEDD